MTSASLQPHGLLSKLLLAAVLGFWLAGACAQQVLPAALQKDGFTAREVGSGLLTWFGFEIYTASLWTPDGEFAGLDALRQPVALSLWYRRSFTRERLIEITRDGWSEFQLATPQQQAAWTAQLKKIWVDTRDGANMTALVQPGGATRFYNAERLLGSVDDPAFGPAFLGIWLDERTRGTRLEHLRMALLGKSAAAACGTQDSDTQRKSCR